MLPKTTSLSKKLVVFGAERGFADGNGGPDEVDKWRKASAEGLESLVHNV